jgi:hypothetical protein
MRGNVWPESLEQLKHHERELLVSMRNRSCGGTVVASRATGVFLKALAILGDRGNMERLPGPGGRALQ